MLTAILIGLGIVLMGLGLVMLNGWISGRSAWFDAGTFDRQGPSKVDRQLLQLHFLVKIVGPLLLGAVLIALAAVRLAPSPL